MWCLLTRLMHVLVVVERGFREKSELLASCMHMVIQ